MYNGWIKGVVSKETVVLRRRVSSTQEFGFINGVDKCKLNHRTGILKADVSSVSPSSEQIEELWVVYDLYRRDGATLLVLIMWKTGLN